MAGLVPATHKRSRREHSRAAGRKSLASPVCMGGRDKPGHDVLFEFQWVMTQLKARPDRSGRALLYAACEA